MKNKIKNQVDFVTGLVMIGFCALVITQTSELPYETAMFPRTVMVIGAGLGAAVVLKSLFKPGPEQKNKPFWSVSVAEILLVVWIYALLLLAGTIGLFTITYVVLTTVSVYIALKSGKGVRQCLFLAGYSAAIVAVLYVLFKIVLGIRVPDGLFI